MALSEILVAGNNFPQLPNRLKTSATPLTRSPCPEDVLRMQTANRSCFVKSEFRSRGR